VTPEIDDPDRDGPFEPLDPEAERALAEALRAAFDPEPIDPERHRQILELSLEDPFAPASDDELRESARLRRALDQDDLGHPDAALARALRNAVEPSALRPRALPEAGEKPGAERSRGRVVYATFGAVALAAAAAFALFISRPSGAPDAALAARSKLVASRPTGELFAERFEPGAATERIDRIALARQRDLRDNRYALWGVR